MAVRQGTTLGRYRLLERAGAGGMSEVWKAEDQTLHRTVAVKVIHDPIAADPSFTERFLREARLVAGLEHPHILSVYDFGTALVEGREVSYLVMPLVTGGSLKERITGPVPYGEAVAWLAAVGAALDHAHTKGILHRDVKPGNVLLDSGGRPLLADFGLARSADSVSGLTATGTVLGTPSYMAPEQAMGKALDPRADQYALAVIAFELLTGKVPFKADSPLAVLHQHVSVAPAPLTSVLPGVPPSADAVMDRALAKDPASRYPSCTDFVSALGAALGVSLPALSGALVTGVTAPEPRPIPPPLPAPPREGAPTELLTQHSQQATIVSGGGFPRPEERMAAPASVPPRPPVPPRPESGGAGRAFAIAAIVVVVLAAGGTGAFLFLRGRAKDAPGTSQGKPAETPVVAAEPTAAPASPASLAAAEPAPEPTAAPAVQPSLQEGAQAGARTGAPAGVSDPPPPAPREPSGGDRSQAGRGGPRNPPSGRPSRGNGPQPSVAENVAPPPAERFLLPRREPIVPGNIFSADSSLAGAFTALDTSRKPEGKLSRTDLSSALGDAREVLSRRQSPEARFLDAYTRAGLAFADGRTSESCQLLQRAYDADPHGATEGRVLRFVAFQLKSLGPNPGPDGAWVLGLAFGDVRGDLDEELEKATGRAPHSANLAYARALRALEKRDAQETLRNARQACGAGIREACELLPAGGRSSR